MCVLKSTFAFKIGIALCALFMVVVPATTADATGGRPEDPSHALRAVEEAAAELVAKEDGPPGVIVVIQRRNDRQVIRAGVANHDHVAGHFRRAGRGVAAIAIDHRIALPDDDDQHPHPR